MLSYQSQLYSLIQRLGFSDEKKEQEAYSELEQTFLDRWLTTLVALLPEGDKATISKKLEEGASATSLYDFLDATFDDIDTLNQNILTEFVQEYKDLVGLD